MVRGAQIKGRLARRSTRWIAIALASIAASVLAGCGADEPSSAATKAELVAALAGAPPPLNRLYARPNLIVGGGQKAFRKQLAELRGRPVVVNKWAAWCGPCRFEFPFFQRQVKKRGKRIAFLAVDSRDARDDAKRFLTKLPVPYPSFFDPDGKIAASFRGDRVSPTTAFYDSRGELAYTKQGGYASESALADDVTRYAR